MKKKKRVCLFLTKEKKKNPLDFVEKTQHSSRCVSV
jgi:hypothetical protein